MIIFVVYALTVVIVWFTIWDRVQKGSVISDKAKFFTASNERKSKYSLILKTDVRKSDIIPMLDIKEEDIFRVSLDTYIVFLEDQDYLSVKLDELGDYNAALYISHGEQFTPDELFEMLFNGLKQSRRVGINHLVTIDFDGEEMFNRLGFAKKGFVPYFQPIFEGDKIVGLESLARWNSTRDVFPPSIFLPVAIRNKIIQSLDLRLITESIKNYIYLKHNYDVDHVRLFLKVSNESLDTKFVERIKSLITIFPELKKENVVFEIDADDVGNMYIDELKRFGFRLGIGMQLSNKDFILSHDKFDCVKIPSDMLAFVNKEDLSHLVRSKACLIGAFVESNEHIKNFKEKEIVYLQGYHLSKPSGLIGIRSLLEVNLWFY